MSYTSKNPRNETEILVDQGVTAIAATVSGTNRVINRSGKLWVQDSAGLESPLGSNGSAGVNYLASQFAADLLGTVSTTAAGDTLASSTRSDPTKWATSTGTALITQSTNSTLRGTTNYLIAYTANAQYVESPLFTLDGSDLGKPLLVQFDLSGVSTADDVQCYVVRYNTSNVLQERILVAGTASATTPFSAQLPLSTSSFRGFFVSGATSTDKYALRWLRNATNTSLRLDSFVVGPQSLATAAAVTAWQQYTPTFSAGFGTVTVDKMFYRRIGDSIEISGNFTTGTVSAATATFTLPSGLTNDTSKRSVTSNPRAGRWYWATASASTRKGGSVLTDAAGSNLVYFGSDDYTTAVSPASGLLANAFVNSTNIIWIDNCVIPISQWSSGTTTLADRAVEEYAYNTSTATGASDTTSFGYGISGAKIQAITTGISRRVRFTSPILATDTILVEVSTDQIKWQNLAGGWQAINAANISPITYQNGVYYGLGKLTMQNATDVDVFFGDYSATTGATYGAAGAAWTTPGAGYWRLRKISGGSTVGFPVSARNIVGDTSGTAVPAGYVGEVIKASTATLSITTSLSQFLTITLTPGKWSISTNVAYNDTTATLLTVAVGTTTASAAGCTLGTNLTYSAIAAASGKGGASLSFTVELTTQTIYYLNGNANAASPGSTSGAVLTAIRIA